MDDNQTPQQQPRPIPVMDIQPPQAPVPASPLTPATVSNDAVTEEPDNAVVEAPAQQQDVPVNEPVEDVTPTAAPDAQIPATAEPAEATQLVAVPGAAAHKQHKAPLVPIIIALIVAIALAVVAVLLYLGQDKTTTNKGTANTSQNQSTTTPATTEAIDETSKAVDDSLSGVDDTKDFDDASLSDSTLAL